MTDLQTAAQQLLGALDKSLYMNDYCGLEVSKHDQPDVTDAIENLRAALAEYDKDRVKVEEMKANWALQRKLAQETEERDRQQREYEEQRLAALAEPVPDWSICPACGGMASDPIVPQRPAESAQEPVAYSVGRSLHWHQGCGVTDAQLYTTPPQRKPLSEEEIQAAWDSVDMRHPRGNETRIAFARAIERAHGVKE